jgi:hypothetical protein
MSDRDVIESKMSYLRKRLATAKKYRAFKLQQIQQEGIVRGAVERELIFDLPVRHRFGRGPDCLPSISKTQYHARGF